MKTWMWWALGIGVVAGVGVGGFALYRYSQRENAAYAFNQRVQALASRLYTSTLPGATGIAQQLVALQSTWRGGPPTGLELVTLSDLEQSFAHLQAQALPA